MNSTRIKSIVFIVFLAVLTGGAMLWLENTPAVGDPGIGPGTTTTSNKSGPVSFSATLTQDKIFVHGDPTFSVALTMTADTIVTPESRDAANVDLIIVLDRSGSMEGDKIRDAKAAIQTLLASLSDGDRFALVSYSDGVVLHSGLVPATPEKRQELSRIVDRIAAGGNTNLGGGLEQGIKAYLDANQNKNLGKVILISDGLANQGVTDHYSLGQMASIAVRKEFTVSTVGVGLDYNEELMSLIADKGAGSYHFMETPDAFAQLFLDELHKTRNVAASAVEIRVPVPDGLTLVDAAGMPFEMQGSVAVLNPGVLLSGQTRSIYLTFRADARQDTKYTVSGIELNYRNQNERYQVALTEPLTVACVQDESEAYASIDRVVWEEKVVQEDYNKLKEEVAGDLKKGDREAALQRIDDYRDRQSAVNESVQSDKVAENLDQDLSDLESQVEDTFVGSASEVEYKQKSNSKAIQQEGFSERRDK